MIFTIKRTYKDKGTPGKLYHEDKLFCYTIERPKTGEYPCIPEGTYTASRYDSPKHGPNTWQLDSVPGRSHIQFHVANYPSELLGCIAPGMNPIDGLEPGVSSSRIAYKKFMDLTEGESQITFVIESE